MLTLLLAATLAAETRPVAVMATSKRPGADQYTTQTAERVHAALRRENVPGLLELDEATKLLNSAGIPDPRTCQATRACVGKLALIFGPKGVVVSVDTARAGNALAIILQAVSGDGPRVLNSTELTLPIGKESEDAALPIVLFARELKAKLEAEAPKEVAVEPKPEEDKPVKTTLDPPPPEPPLVVAKPPPGPGKAVGGVLLGVGAASGVAAVIMSVVSGAAVTEYQGSLTAGGTESNKPMSELRVIQGRANGAATGALIAGGAAVGLAVVGVVLLVSSN